MRHQKICIRVKLSPNNADSSSMAQSTEPFEELDAEIQAAVNSIQERIIALPSQCGDSDAVWSIWDELVTEAMELERQADKMRRLLKEAMPR
jgi:hypothetical protein